MIHAILKVWPFAFHSPHPCDEPKVLLKKQLIRDRDTH